MKLRPLLTAIILICLIITSCENSSRKEGEKTVNTLKDLGALPKTAKFPADNPPGPEKIELGRMLFYDPILSGNKDVSCATCHHPEFGYAEIQEISIGVNGHGLGSFRQFNTPNNIPFTKRNSQTILNAAFNGIDSAGNYDPVTAPMFWDLRSKSLEAQSLEPIKALEEMRGHGYKADSVINEIVNRIRAIPEYQKLFKEAFKTEDAVSKENLAKAIAAFERTLITPNSRFDQYMRGDSSALSSFEKEGLQLFLKAGCANCHKGPMLSDYKVHVLAVQDNEKLLQSDSGTNRTYAFRTPSLRNLRFTPPYMHSGKVATLENVLEFYEDLQGKEPRNLNVKKEQIDPLIKDLKLDFKDLRMIVEFLNSLNDSDFDKKIPEHVPSGLKVGGNIQ